MASTRQNQEEQSIPNQSEHRAENLSCASILSVVDLLSSNISVQPPVLHEDDDDLILIERDEESQYDKFEHSVIGAPIDVAGSSKVSILVDETGLTRWFLAPFHVAGPTMRSAVEGGGIENRLGRFPELRANPVFIASANREKGAARTFADTILQGRDGDGFESIREILVHPDGPRETPVTFTRGDGERFHILVYSLLARFGDKKAEATAFGRQSNTNGPAGIRIDIENSRNLELLDSLYNVLCREYEFHGIKWTTLTPNKTTDHHLLTSWKSGVPTFKYQRNSATQDQINLATVETWCESRGIVIKSEGE